MKVIQNFLKIGMQTNSDEKYLIQVGHFSHENTGWKVSHSGGAFFSWKHGMKSISFRWGIFLMETLDEKYLIQVGHFSHGNTGWKVSHSGRAFFSWKRGMKSISFRWGIFLMETRDEKYLTSERHLTLVRFLTSYKQL